MNRLFVSTPEYQIGDVVYLRTAGEKAAGMITGYIIRSESMVYLVSWGDDHCETAHYPIELADEFVTIK